jgi:uncharacterized protein
MARRIRCRRVGCLPPARCFKPQGVPLSDLDEVAMTVDEFEALRLADLDGLYQDQAADEMNVSRQTFGRIIESAHRKVAQVLVQSKALRIAGGEFTMAETRRFRCHECRHDWELPYGTGRPNACPKCASGNIHRAEEDRGPARRGRFGGGQCQRRAGMCRGRASTVQTESG